MTSVVLKTADEQEFFKHGRGLARRVDTGTALAEEQTVSFEDPAELLNLLTAARLEVFRTVREQPGSITGLAERLHRDRSAVKHDIDQLARAGMVRIESKVLPGHGRMKEVCSSAGSFRLEVVLA